MFSNKYSKYMKYFFIKDPDSTYAELDMQGKICFAATRHVLAFMNTIRVKIQPPEEPSIHAAKEESLFDFLPKPKQELRAQDSAKEEHAWQTVLYSLWESASLNLELKKQFLDMCEQHLHAIQHNPTWLAYGNDTTKNMEILFRTSVNNIRQTFEIDQLKNSIHSNAYKNNCFLLPIPPNFPRLEHSDAKKGTYDCISKELIRCANIIAKQAGLYSDAASNFASLAEKSNEMLASANRYTLKLCKYYNGIKEPSRARDQTLFRAIYSAKPFKKDGKLVIDEQLVRQLGYVTPEPSSISQSQKENESSCAINELDFDELAVIQVDLAEQKKDPIHAEISKELSEIPEEGSGALLRQGKPIEPAKKQLDEWANELSIIPEDGAIAYVQAEKDVLTASRKGFDAYSHAPQKRPELEAVGPGDRFQTEEHLGKAFHKWAGAPLQTEEGPSKILMEAVTPELQRKDLTIHSLSEWPGVHVPFAVALPQIPEESPCNSNGAFFNKYASNQFNSEEDSSSIPSERPSTIRNLVANTTKHEKSAGVQLHTMKK